MTARFTFLIVLSLFAASARAEKLAPLVTMQLGGEKATLSFDPAKVTAIYTSPTFSVETSPLEDRPEQKPGPNSPHAWGITSGPIAINDKPEDFLKAIKATKKFITLHSALGEVHLRATSISLIQAPYSQADIKEGKIKALVYNSALQPAGNGTPTPWAVTETPDQVRELVNDKRTKDQE